jgi:hypothetical protein
MHGITKNRDEIYFKNFHTKKMKNFYFMTNIYENENFFFCLIILFVFEFESLNRLLFKWYIFSAEAI